MVTPDLRAVEYSRDRETVVFFAGTIKDKPVQGVVRTMRDEDRVTNSDLWMRPFGSAQGGLADVGL